MNLIRSGEETPCVDADGLPGWSINQRTTIYLCAAVLGISLLFLLVYLRVIWKLHSNGRPGHPPPFGDFFALWSYAKITTEHPVATLYDMATLHARQVALGMRPDAINPFPYPPTAMFLFAPLCWGPYDAAYLVWMISSLGLFIWSVHRTCSRLAPCLLFVLISPAATGNIFAGQSGFFSAAALTAGLRLAPSRPIMGGVLLSLMSCKPQLGILIPVALAAAGLWRTLATACFAAFCLALAATMAFGSNTWQAWLSMLPSYAGLLDEAGGSSIMPTVIANLQMAGVSLGAARIAQAVAAITVAIFVALCFRRDPGPLAVAALLVGVFLASPHALFYDLPMITAAMVLLIQARIDTSGRFSTFEVVALVLAALFPVMMLVKKFPIPISIVPLALLFIAIVRAHGDGRRADDPRRPITP